MYVGDCCPNGNRRHLLIAITYRLHCVENSFISIINDENSDCQFRVVTFFIILLNIYENRIMFNIQVNTFYCYILCLFQVFVAGSSLYPVSPNTYYTYIRIYYCFRSKMINDINIYYKGCEGGRLVK